MASRKKIKKRIRLIVFSIITLILVGAFITFAPTISRVMQLRQEALLKMTGCNADTFKSTQTTVVYDCNGQQLLTMRAAKDMYYLDISEIPIALQNAFIITEDKKFYTHKGVDYLSIVRALIANKQSNTIEQGASTITQQLARNVFLSHEVNWDRKIEEMFIAMEIENRFSKEKIMEFYCNNIYFASGFYGIEAASKGYFGKNVNELTLSQLIFLAAIPNNPNRYNPVENYNNTIERRNLILSIMYEAKMLSTNEYHTAKNEEIVLKISPTQHNNYVDTYVKRCATESMMRAAGFVFKYDFANDKEYDIYCDEYDKYYGFCQQKLFGGGYSIYTSINPKFQQYLQEAVDSNLSSNQQVNEYGKYKLQGAATCVDNSSGKVVAIVGGRTEEHEGYTINRAYQSYRQPGSSIKPLNVYTPYLQMGASPSTVVCDEEIEGGPRNADGIFAGDMILREAVRVSKNTIAWKIYDLITPRGGIGFLFNMRFKKLYMDKDKIVGALGGFSYGVTTEEMAGAYATIENDGVYRMTTCIEKIEAVDNTIVVDNKNLNVKVYDVNACRMMTDMLMTVMEEGTGVVAAIDNYACAGKTGTTNDNKDSWFCGFTRYYTMSVWTGYDMPQPIVGELQASKLIWHDFMEKVHVGLPNLPFSQYVYKGKSHAHGEPDDDFISEKEEETTTQEASTQTATETGSTKVNPYAEKDATVAGKGDKDATMSAGDKNATMPVGDKDATMPAGDRDANKPVGDKDAYLQETKTNMTMRGDQDATQKIR